MSDWTVLVFGTFSATVTVNADSAEEAKSAAIEAFQNGEDIYDIFYSGHDTDDPEPIE